MIGGGGEREAECNLHPWGGTVKEDRVLQFPGKPPHLQEDQRGTERELRRLRGEYNTWFVAGRTETP